jgi:hypothetical protein
MLGCPNAFFEADAVAVKEPPDRTEPSLLSFFKQPTLDLFQRQIRLCPHQADREASHLATGSPLSLCHVAYTNEDREWIGDQEEPRFP